MKIFDNLSKILVILICVLMIYTTSSTAYSIANPPQQLIKTMRWQVSDLVGMDLYFIFEGEKPFRTEIPIKCKFAAGLAGIISGQSQVSLSDNLTNFRIWIGITNSQKDTTSVGQEWYRGGVMLENFPNTNESFEESLWTHHGEETLIFHYPGDVAFEVILYNESQHIIERIDLNQLLYLEGSSHVSDVLQTNSIVMAAESLALIAVLEIIRVFGNKKEPEV